MSRGVLRAIVKIISLQKGLKNGSVSYTICSDPKTYGNYKKYYSAIIERNESGGYDMGISKIQKRNGEIVDYSLSKIKSAIFAAAKAVGGQDEVEAQRLAGLVEAVLAETYRASIPSVEDIQDLVEKILIEEGHAKTAKAYILYRREREELRISSNLFMDAEQMIEEYVSLDDWRVKENSNMGYSLQGLNNHIVESITQKYLAQQDLP